MPKPICPNGHTPRVFIVLLKDGMLANMYEDGTIGLSGDDWQAASDSETVFCPICLSECNLEPK